MRSRRLVCVYINAPSHVAVAHSSSERNKPMLMLQKARLAGMADPKQAQNQISQCVEAPLRRCPLCSMCFLSLCIFTRCFLYANSVGSCSFLSSFKMYFSALGVFFFLCLFRVQVQGHLVFFWRKHARQVELDVLIHKEGHTGRWQDPNEVWS